MVTLGLGGTGSAPCKWGGGRGSRPLLPAAAGPWGQGLSPPGAAQVEGRDHGGRPARPGRTAQGRQRFLKLAQIPPQLAAAGGAARGFPRLRLRRVSSRPRLLLRALTLLWPPKAPCGPERCACPGPATGRAGPGWATTESASPRALRPPPGRRPGPPGFTQRQHQRLARGEPDSAELLLCSSSPGRTLGRQRRERGAGTGVRLGFRTSDFPRRRSETQRMGLLPGGRPGTGPS